MTIPTKAELVAQCKKDNPTMVETINGVQRTLNPEEYNLAAEKWAEMQLEILTGVISDGTPNEAATK